MRIYVLDSSDVWNAVDGNVVIVADSGKNKVQMGWEARFPGVNHVVHFVREKETLLTKDRLGKLVELLEKED